MDGRDRAPPTEAGSGGGDEGLGKGVEQRGSPYRPEEAYGGESPEALLAEEMDSRAHFRLVGPEQEDEQRLRKAAGEWRSLHLRSDESPDGEEIGSPMRLFRQFHGEVLRIAG
jgi:hypothetical protein